MFGDCSIDTNIRQKVVETVTKMPVAGFFNDRVWRRIGAQNDAYIKPKGKWTFGVLQQNLLSNNIKITPIQPIIGYAFPKGRSVNAGSQQWAFNWLTLTGGRFVAVDGYATPFADGMRSFGRKGDRWGAGHFYSSTSDSLRDSLRPILSLRGEQGVEIYYNFGLGRGFHLSPDIEVVQPADGRRDWTAIPGLRLFVDF